MGGEGWGKTETCSCIMLAQPTALTSILVWVEEKKEIKEQTNQQVKKMKENKQNAGKRERLRDSHRERREKHTYRELEGKKNLIHIEGYRCHRNSEDV